MRYQGRPFTPSAIGTDLIITKDGGGLNVKRGSGEARYSCRNNLDSGYLTNHAESASSGLDTGEILASGHIILATTKGIKMQYGTGQCGLFVENNESTLQIRDWANSTYHHLKPNTITALGDIACVNLNPSGLVDGVDVAGVHP
jgi:hypothetical protein